MNYNTDIKSYINNSAIAGFYQELAETDAWKKAGKQSGQISSFPAFLMILLYLYFYKILCGKSAFVEWNIKFYSAAN